MLPFFCRMLFIIEIIIISSGRENYLNNSFSLSKEYLDGVKNTI